MRAAACLLVLCAAPIALATPSSNPQAALEQGKEAYKRGLYGTVVETVEPLLYPNIELSTEDSVVEAHKLLALSYFYMKKEDKAAEEVSSLLQLRPGYELDTFLEAPVAVRFWNGVRQRQDERLRELRRRQKEEEAFARRDEEKRRAEAKARAERVFIEKQIVRRSRMIALLPFGIGQLQNGERGKAIAFGVTEGALGAASLSMWIAVEQRFSSGQVPKTDKTLAEALLGVQLASGAAFWALVVWGIIDAQVRFKAESIIRTREIAPPKKEKLSLSLSPVVSPGMWGLGMGGRF